MNTIKSVIAIILLCFATSFATYSVTIAAEAKSQHEQTIEQIKANTKQLAELGK